MADPRNPDANGSLTPGSGDPHSTLSSKRQRRPSVRLGEIGEQPAAAIPFESYVRRCKQYNIPFPTFSRPSDDSKPPPPKPKRKRPRSTWPPSGPDEAKPEDEGDGSEELRWDDSASPVREHSVSDRAALRVGCNKDDEPSETNHKGWGKTSAGTEVSVRTWLDGLGLSRYTPVFEIHEVDVEVLPLLTLEDLKDMGISAVGTRRKMYSAIQKLGKDSSREN